MSSYRSLWLESLLLSLFVIFAAVLQKFQLSWRTFAFSNGSRLEDIANVCLPFDDNLDDIRLVCSSNC